MSFFSDVFGSAPGTEAGGSSSFSQNNQGNPGYGGVAPSVAPSFDDLGGWAAIDALGGWSTPAVSAPSSVSYGFSGGSGGHNPSRSAVDPTSHYSAPAAQVSSFGGFEGGSGGYNPSRSSIDPTGFYEGPAAQAPTFSDFLGGMAGSDGLGGLGPDMTARAFSNAMFALNAPQAKSVDRIGGQAPGQIVPTSGVSELMANNLGSPSFAPQPSVYGYEGGSGGLNPARSEVTPTINPVTAYTPPDTGNPAAPTQVNAVQTQPQPDTYTPNPYTAPPQPYDPVRQEFLQPLQQQPQAPGQIAARKPSPGDEIGTWRDLAGDVDTIANTVTQGGSSGIGSISPNALAAWAQLFRPYEPVQLNPRKLVKR